MVARELDHPTNTGIVDGQVVLDFFSLSWMEKVAPNLASDAPLESSWDLDTDQTAQMLPNVGRELVLTRITLYQTQHSGASIDHW